ncbi:subunit of tubulin prefoldin [Quaeritorhiza haematococci]|nr:subunit of tubulin prefoldin [Quaeritorhiza haematococci]
MAKSQGPPQQLLDLTKLPLPQLQSVRQQMEEELEHLSASFSSLKQAQAKFSSSLDCLDELSKSEPGKAILVPLTGSISFSFFYEIANVKTVIVDVGTGYFVEKSRDDAKDFYKRKVDYLKTNLASLQETVMQRQNQMRVLLDVMAMKASESKSS